MTSLFEERIEVVSEKEAEGLPLTPDLRREIRYVLAVMGGTEQLIERAIVSTHKELRELELDALTDIDR